MVSIYKKFFLLNLTFIIITYINIAKWNVLKGSERSPEQDLAVLYIRDTKTYSENNFKCYEENKSNILKDFYRLDCENPFLKNISQAKLRQGDDVCELFNESVDGSENRTLYHRIKMDFQHFTENFTQTDIKDMDFKCPECHHIQYIDGQLFIVHRTNAFNYQTRSRSVKMMLKQVTDTFKNIGDFEMFIHLRK